MKSSDSVTIQEISCDICNFCNEQITEILINREKDLRRMGNEIANRKIEIRKSGVIRKRSENSETGWRK